MVIRPLCKNGPCFNAPRCKLTGICAYVDIGNRVIEFQGHAFDVMTQACSCGMTQAMLVDGDKRTHDDMMNPGTTAAIYRQRSTGREIAYRKPKR